MTEAEKKDRVLKVVDAGHLRMSSSAGWALVERFEQDTFESEVQMTYHAPSGDWTGTFRPKAADEKILRRSFFLLELNPDSALAEKSDEAERLHQALSMSEETCRQLKREAEDRTKKLAEVEEQRKRITESYDALTRTRADEGKRLLKYEKDIAKLRTALGDLRMREILEGKGQ